MDRINDLLNDLAEASKKALKSDSYPSKDTDPEDLEDQSTITEEEELLETKTISDDHMQEFLGMAIASLKNIASDASSILEHLDDENVKINLTEPWVQGMIAVVENNMAAVHDFIKFSPPEDDDTVASSKKRPGLWENIRKKKEKEGKNYRPAKPEDKDRPDPEAWKRLTK